jgi:hypothetical protein
MRLAGVRLGGSRGHLTNVESMMLQNKEHGISHRILRLVSIKIVKNSVLCKHLISLLMAGQAICQLTGVGMVTDVRDFGAVGDGQVALDCSMTSGSRSLRCTTAHFSAAKDTGKVIAVYDAGPTNNGFIQPLTTRISSASSDGKTVILAAAATNTTRTSVITNCTNTTPIVCSTSTAHGFDALIDSVTISGNSAANGIYAAGAYRAQGSAITLVGTKAHGAALGGSATAGLYSSRVIWGTDDGPNIQKAVDHRASLQGGVVYFPAGIYLTRNIDLPCGGIGIFASGTCPRTYSNIVLAGDSKNGTVIENWDIGVDPGNTGYGGGNAYAGVITLGRYAQIKYYEAANNPLSGVQITRLTVNQVKNPTTAYAKGISAYASRDIEIRNIAVASPSYEGLMPCGGDKCTEWYIHDSLFTKTGFGGPAYTNTTAALNINSSYTLVQNNVVIGSAQGIENGGHDNRFIDNILIGPSLVAFPNSLCVNMNSGTFWNNSFEGNTCDTWGGWTYINVLGIATQIYVRRNVFKDVLSGVALKTGNEVNALTNLPVKPPSPHGMSEFCDNRFIYSDAAPAIPTSYSIAVGADEESLNICNNTIQHQTQICMTGPNYGRMCNTNSDCKGNCRIPAGALAFLPGYGGGAKWTPSNSVLAASATRSRPALVTPSIDNGYYYETVTSCTTGTTEPVWPSTANGTVVDNTCTWIFKGKRPTATVSGLKLMGPANSVGFPNGDISYGLGVARQLVVFDGLFSTYPLTFSYPAATQSTNDVAMTEVVPAGFPYSDSERYSLALPTGGKWKVNQRVFRPTPNLSFLGWRVTRSGAASPAWSPNKTYTFGEFAEPSTDNGHIYLQTAPSGCTSARNQPSFPTRSGTTVNEADDSRCVWKEAGPSAQFIDIR